MTISRSLHRRADSELSLGAASSPGSGGGRDLARPECADQLSPRHPGPARGRRPAGGPLPRRRRGLQRRVRRGRRLLRHLRLRHHRDAAHGAQRDRPDPLPAFYARRMRGCCPPPRWCWSRRRCRAAARARGDRRPLGDGLRPRRSSASTGTFGLRRWLLRRRPAALPLHTWSLAVEEQFYLVWPHPRARPLAPRCAVAGPRLGGPRCWPLGAITVVSFVASWAGTVVPIGGDLRPLRLLVTDRAWEFGLGRPVALAWSRQPGRAAPVLGAAWTGVAPSPVRRQPHQPSPSPASPPWPPWSAPGPLAGAAAADNGPSRPSPPGPSLAWGPVLLLYLWHWPAHRRGGLHRGRGAVPGREHGADGARPCLCDGQLHLRRGALSQGLAAGAQPAVPDSVADLFALVIAVAGLVHVRAGDQGPTEMPGFASPAELGSAPCRRPTP